MSLTGSKYVWLEKLNLKGGDRHTLSLNNCQHIRIENCEFSGNSRSVGQDLNGTGQYLRKDGKNPYSEGAVAFQNSGNILMERNYIHTPAGTAQSWFYSHPFGPMAVATGNLTGIR